MGMGSTLTDKSAARAVADDRAPSRPSLVEEGRRDGDLVTVGDPVTEEALVTESDLADLEDPNLVLSPGYIGHDRRASGLKARVLRATYSQRRSLLRLEFVVAAVATVVLMSSVLLVGSGTHLSSTQSSSNGAGRPSTHARTKAPTAAPAAVARPATTTPAPTTTAPAPATTVPAPKATTPPPATSVAPTAPASAPAASPAPTAPPTTSPPLTPDQMGAQALALINYDWHKIPGYSIQFHPISEAPAPGYYGNTTFTWGQAGGVSDLYVYPGETVQRLAAITAFEIGHEVDAAGVDPAGGHAQIENILNYSPPNGWAPSGDSPEQNYLSGWYSAAFSNQWTTTGGVGEWSQILPEPSGATLTAMQPWLNPAIH